ncbi:hypothetical protein E2C01_038773 [Portunus trituberculatus]|uniref:Uncharacterized protein n=1 Tax=Portunus trituberculatus TaxID=210409 RepID=A0A5B7FBP9_PORTR|nr:hypothetical protein [Portunus trituberculatus]
MGHGGQTRAGQGKEGRDRGAGRVGSGRGSRAAPSRRHYRRMLVILHYTNIHGGTFSPFFLSPSIPPCPYLPPSLLPNSSRFRPFLPVQPFPPLPNPSSFSSSSLYLAYHTAAVTDNHHYHHHQQQQQQLFLFQLLLLL